jgi:hypothetical protein
MEKMKSVAETAIYKDILDVNVYDCADRVRKAAIDAVYSFSDPASAKELVNAINILSSICGVNVKKARRRIADKLIADNVYRF